MLVCRRIAVWPPPARSDPTIIGRRSTPPPNYKEAGDWKPSEPNDALDRGPWWEIFNDEVLNQLEAQDRHFEPKRQSGRGRLRSGAGPGRAGARRLLADRRASPTGSQRDGPAPRSPPAARRPVTQQRAPRRHLQRGSFGQLGPRYLGPDSPHAPRATAPRRKPVRPRSPRRGCPRRPTLATDYFELRAQDQLQKLLDDTVVAEQLSLKITESRYRFGVAAKADVVSARGAAAVEPGAASQRQNSTRHSRARDCRADRPAAGAILPERLAPCGPTCRRCPPEFPPRCSSGGPTSPKRSARSRPPMRRSASRRRPIFRA